MSDIADRAQISDEIFESALLHAHQCRHRDTADIDDEGNHWCISCGELIPAARLDAEPDAARCIECQLYHERRGR
ncbi:TraR/DksA C4-type zinc finger protein [Grimontia sp. NTOU-MAR1]|uniref:TraR/DksA C4-type zinc finger protein n=1 Tax=Grimontia sp. NTOU-MAR1 TaxID=3111011 RepID=UPI002DBB0303|nr:TraR/DksA C4-type zinc finger protein [Grimontia sp. NTOU-MAR1]WRV98557.1 TraR/DksA C4-type zinc finger protein [Grimontia sp. NTOU-MAR1]